MALLRPALAPARRGATGTLSRLAAEVDGHAIPGGRFGHHRQHRAAGICRMEGGGNWGAAAPDRAVQARPLHDRDFRLPRSRRAADRAASRLGSPTAPAGRTGVVSVVAIDALALFVTFLRFDRQR